MLGEQVIWFDEAVHCPKLNGSGAKTLLNPQGVSLHMTEFAEA